MENKTLLLRQYDRTPRKEYVYPQGLYGDEMLYFQLIDDDGITVSKCRSNIAAYNFWIGDYHKQDVNPEHFFIQKVFSEQIKYANFVL